MGSYFFLGHSQLIKLLTRLEYIMIDIRDLECNDEYCIIFHKYIVSNNNSTALALFLLLLLLLHGIVQTDVVVALRIEPHHVVRSLRLSSGC